MKGLSNPEISRSPRNSFRASLGRLPWGVEHRMAAGASPPTKANRTPNTQGPEPGSQNMWAKLCVREGNSPDRPPRPPSPCRVAKDVRLRRQPGRWLRSSHPSKECVTAHWPSWRAPTIHGAKHGAEAAGRGPKGPVGRGASRAAAKRRGRRAVERAGVRMLARVARPGRESPAPDARGLLGKARPPRVSRGLRRGRQA